MRPHPDGCDCPWCRLRRDDDPAAAEFVARVARAYAGRRSRAERHVELDVAGGLQATAIPCRACGRVLVAGDVLCIACDAAQEPMGM